MRTLSLGSLLALVLAVSPTAHAWEKHQALMPLALSNPSPDLKKILEQEFAIPCESDDLAMMGQLISELQLNPSSKLPTTSLSLAGGSLSKGSVIKKCGAAFRGK